MQYNSLHLNINKTLKKSMPKTCILLKGRNYSQDIQNRIFKPCISAQLHIKITLHIISLLDVLVY